MIMIIFKLFLIVFLLKLLISSDEPLMCTGIYTGFIFVATLLLGESFSTVMLYSVISFGISAMYFFALYHLQSGAIYWLVTIVGFFVLLI